jgi:hypothetical protein
MSELIERLREEWLQKATSSFTCQECGIQANLIDAVVDQLQTDASEITRLQEALTAAEAERDANSHLRDAFDRAVEWKSRAIEAEALLAETRKKALEEGGWQDIETAPRDGTPVIIAVPTKDQDDFHVGEAYFDPEHYDNGDWWWAGTSYGEYHAGPVSEINWHAPTHWQPLPKAPSRLLNKEDRNG